MPTGQLEGDAGAGPKLRLGIIGCGAAAAIHHLPAAGASRDVEVTVLVDRERGRAEDLARRFRVPAVATSVAEAAHLMDAAVVTVPNPLHCQVTCELLQRGVHVLVEKPMAATVAECDAMLAAAAAARRVLAVGLEFRFSHATTLVRELLDRELVGSLLSFDLRLGVISRWPFATDHFLKPGGGVLADFGSHLLDLLLAWLDELTVVAYRDDQLGGTESDCEIELATKRNVSGFVEISRTRNLRNTVRFTGERGVLEVGLWHHDPTVRLTLAGGTLALEGHARADRKQWDDFEILFERQLADWVAAMRTGSPPRVTGAEGRRSVALIERCGELRRPLDLPWLALPKVGGGR